MTGGSQAGKTSATYVTGAPTYVTGAPTYVAGPTYTTQPISGQTVTYTTAPQTYEYHPSSTTYVDSNGYTIDPKTNQYATGYEYVTYPEAYVTGQK